MEGASTIIGKPDEGPRPKILDIQPSTISKAAKPKDEPTICTRR